MFYPFDVAYAPCLPYCLYSPNTEHSQNYFVSKVKQQKLLSVIYSRLPKN